MKARLARNVWVFGFCLFFYHVESLLYSTCFSSCPVPSLAVKDYFKPYCLYMGF